MSGPTKVRKLSKALSTHLHVTRRITVRVPWAVSGTAWVDVKRVSRGAGRSPGVFYWRSSTSRTWVELSASVHTAWGWTHAEREALAAAGYTEGDVR